MLLVKSSTPHRFSQAVAVDGVSISYEDLGSGDPLVLLHGLADNRESWHEAGHVELFRRRGRRLILIDCRGLGRSGKPHEPTAYSGRRRAADIVAVLDHAGIQCATLMGHSMGGNIALATAAHHPDRVSALIINGAHPFAEDLTPLRAVLKDNFEAWFALLKQLAPDVTPYSYRRIRDNDLIAVQASLARDRSDFSGAFEELAIPRSAVRSIHAAGAFRNSRHWLAANFCRSQARTMSRPSWTQK